MILFILYRLTQLQQKLHERFKVGKDFDLISINELNFNSEWMAGMKGAVDEFVYEDVLKLHKLIKLQR